MGISRWIAGVAAISALALSARPDAARAVEQPMVVQVFNRAFNTMVSLRVKPTALASWSPDLLNGRPVPRDTYREFNVPGNVGCFFDFRRTYEDGEERISEHINVCAAGPAQVNLRED